MESFDILVEAGVQEHRIRAWETIQNLSVENSVNYAAISGVARGRAEDIFSDVETPQEAILTGEIKKLLDDYVKVTQQLVTDIENDVNDIFTP